MINDYCHFDYYQTDRVTEYGTTFPVYSYVLLVKEEIPESKQREIEAAIKNILK